ncbi:glycosyltransferase family 4 protein [Clostridium perfringens]|uniref:glycosyltransferase family 4 protein n=1 Tax=Clostridium perfringens TaxID=1502 RepID=UPI002A352A9C|nr:glycosyltransferase family 4 protein [Clostridium perfringens]
MKLLYISQFFKPERVAASFRAYDNAKIWSENGDDITVFTGYPNFPTGKLFDGYKIKLLEKEVVDRINVIRSKIIVKKNTSKLNRILNSLSFLFFGVFNILFNSKKIGKNYDAVLGTSGTILAPIIAYIYSIKNKVPFILELRDITYIQILAVYGGKKNILYKLIKFIELYLCKKAKKVIVVTAGFKEELIKDGIEEKKIFIIYNGINIDDIKCKDKFLEKDKLVFNYMGNIGASQNLIKVIDVFNNLELNNKDKEMYIIGDGAYKEKIKEYIKLKNIGNIYIKDGMNSSELEKYYEISDFSIVSLNNNEFFKNTIPSKIFQIMGRGGCVLFFGPAGETSNILKKVSDKFIFNEKDTNLISNKLNDILNYEIKIYSYLEKVGKRGRMMVEEEFDRKKLCEKYKEIIIN